jgi:arginyl-tRNA synthetase
MYDSFIRENSNILKDYLLKKYNLKENVTIEKGTISDVEFYTSLPLKIAKKIKKTPMEIANEFSSLKFFGIKKIEVAPPGFLNFYLIDGIYLDYFNSFSVNRHNKNGKKINIEFISANPTGPFNVVSGRAATYGMALSNLFEYLGWSVTKEYYINDAGRQVNIFANSIYKAYQNKYEGRNVEFDEGEYNNPYIYELADIFKSRISDSNDPIELLKKIALKETNDTNK